MVIAPPPSVSGIRSNGLAPGVRAPGFTLPATPDTRRMSLADLKGSAVVLVFYPADFTPVCSSELAILNELLPEFAKLDARTIGISTDSVWSHIGFAADLGLQIPLVSDYHPKGEVSRRYAVYREEDGISERALYVIDKQGTIFWSHVSPIEVNPGVDGVLDALERLAGRPIEASPPPVQRDLEVAR